MSEEIPIIDLFAGPGGLGEGFSAFGKGEAHRFRIGLSVEKDPHAHKTLELRAFYRQFTEPPDSYYAFLRGDLQREELFAKHPREAARARKEAWLASLGSGEDFDVELDARIEEIVGEKRRWVLIGGPPCQAYSIIGRARTNKENDNRNYLYKEYLRILARHRPPVFVMENVKGMLSSRVHGRRIFDEIISDLQNPAAVFPHYATETDSGRYRIFSLVKKVRPEEVNGLKPDDFIIECEKYGIPQARHRVVLLGIREDLSHAAPQVLSPASEPVPLEAVISGLPRLRSGFSKESDGAAKWRQELRNAAYDGWIEAVRQEISADLAITVTERITRMRCPLYDRGNEYIDYKADVREDLRWWYLDSKFPGVCNHTSRGHIRGDIFRYAFAVSFSEMFQRSPKLHEFPSPLQPDHKNAESGHFDDRFRVQIFGRPSTTITSHISKDGHYYIHPDATQCRTFTVREAARLQTFPDNYFFCGNRTQQYIQVGNAVPPLLAYQIAGVVHRFLHDVQ